MTGEVRRVSRGLGRSCLSPAGLPRVPALGPGLAGADLVVWTGLGVSLSCTGEGHLDRQCWAFQHGLQPSFVYSAWSRNTKSITFVSYDRDHHAEAFWTYQVHLSARQRGAVRKASTATSRSGHQKLTPERSP